MNWISGINQNNELKQENKRIAVQRAHCTLRLHICHFLSHSMWVHCADDAPSFSRTIQQAEIVSLVNRPEYSTALHNSFDLNGLNCDPCVACCLLSDVLWYDGATSFPSMYFECFVCHQHFVQKNDGVRLYVLCWMVCNFSWWLTIRFGIFSCTFDFIQFAILLVCFFHIVNFELWWNDKQRVDRKRQKINEMAWGKRCCRKQSRFKEPFSENGSN